MKFILVCYLFVSNWTTNVILDVVHARVERGVENRYGSSRCRCQFVANSIPKPLLQTVERRRFEVRVKLVGKEFRSVGERRQVSDAEDADPVRVLAAAREVRLRSPRHELHQIDVPRLVGLRYSCA